jgi:hypothetical protein
MLDIATLSRWVGHTVHDPTGKRVGELIQVYVEGPHDTPCWLAIKRDVMSTRVDIVPAATAYVGDHGFSVGYAMAAIQSAPAVKDRHHITDAEATALTDHFAGSVPSGG